MDSFQDEPILSFETPAQWRDWLAQHHGEHGPVWLRLAKKGQGLTTVSYAEALDEALCYGWIDSTKRKYDSASSIQRFSRRKPRSIWSQVNQGHVARLEAAGRMQEAGRAAVATAQRNGEWDKAYAAFSKMEVPPDLQARFDAAPAAQAFFETLNKTNRYAYLHRIQNVKKPETRLKRLDWAIEKLLNQEKLH
ncbi:MAG: YdeI/OmpD-associated family protein [Candidatus Sericytochromatia bacterium]